MNTNGCTCENEAEVLYKMYRTMGTLQDIDYVGLSSCCSDSDVHVVISGHTVTVTYANGLVSTYTHDLNSPETFEQSSEAVPVDFVLGMTVNEEDINSIIDQILNSDPQ